MAIAHRAMARVKHFAKLQEEMKLAVRFERGK